MYIHALLQRIPRQRYWDKHASTLATFWSFKYNWIFLSIPNVTGRQMECTHFRIKMDAYGDSVRGPIGKTWVVFISIFKEGSHSTGTQLGGSYLQAALLKGEGVIIRGRTLYPCCVCCCHGQNGALVIMGISSPLASVYYMSDIARDVAISSRICPHKNWLRVRFGQLQSHCSKWTLEELLRWKDFHINI